MKAASWWGHEKFQGESGNLPNSADPSHQIEMKGWNDRGAWPGVTGDHDRSSPLLVLELCFQLHLLSFKGTEITICFELPTVMSDSCIMTL